MHEPLSRAFGIIPMYAHKNQVQKPFWIYGFHPVRAAIMNPRRKKITLKITPNAARRLAQSEVDPGFLEAITKEIVPPSHVARDLPVDAVHQGLALQVLALKQTSLSRMQGKTRLVLLDQVTDPHNVGAILRTATAFACDAVITTTRHSPPESGVLAKSASGALDRIAYVRVTNLARAIETVQKEGFFVIGLDGGADQPLARLLTGGGANSEPVAFVFGAEGKGLRQRTRACCDALAHLPTSPAAYGSLNVSNACASALSTLNVLACSPRQSRNRMGSIKT